MAAKRILIVEDEEALRKACEIALRRAGFTVLSTDGGREGLNLARSQRPDLIILDLLMPFPTGLDVLRTLRGEEATRATPVLVISNSSMQRVVEQVEGLGAEYIVKAELSLRELADRVERRLAQEPAAPAAAPPPAAPTPVPAAESMEAVKPPPVKVRVVPEDVPDVARHPLAGQLEVNCAGCGLRIGIRFAFCPRCGRKLDEVPTVTTRETFR